MNRTKVRPRHNVVSLRVTDEEWELLQQIKRESLKSISEVLRDLMGLPPVEVPEQPQGYRDAEVVARQYRPRRVFAPSALQPAP